jgi:FlaA1/EpsC-like NDP-sugar epimerase
MLVTAAMKTGTLRRTPLMRFGLASVAYLLLFAASYWLAFALRFDLAIPLDSYVVFWLSAPWVLPLKLVTFWLLGDFRRSWRHVTLSDLAALLRSSGLAFLVAAAIDHFAIPQYQIPRSILVIDWGLSFFLIGGVRSAWRLTHEHTLGLFSPNGTRRALIVGADRHGASLANQIQSDAKLKLRVVGFLDPDSAMTGTRLGGIPVLDGVDRAAEIAASLHVDDILVRADSMAGGRLRRLVQDCKERGLNLKVLPAVADLLNGHHRIHLRDVDINDLLRREPVELDRESIASVLDGRTVMVTGAGGSIGTELCRQVLWFKPRSLVLVERTENSLFMIDRELRASQHSSEIQTHVADVLDRRRMKYLFETHRPDVVFHAAAHKHVPMMEANPGEALKNNVFGTKHVADLAHRYGAAAFVLISTDKAVNPSSIMGVSKQLAERYVYTYAEDSATKFIVVRFGNVLGSSGSVVPIFQEQIRQGGPITITDPEMKRFFMTIPEASQLVLQAAAMGKGGEIFVLEMGEPVKIIDLAADLIRLSGLAPDDIEIKIVGPRPGEKLAEELYNDDEQTLSTPHSKLRVAYHRPYSLAEVRQSIHAVRRVLRDPDAALRAKLREIVQEYAEPVPATPVSVGDGPVIDLLSGTEKE